MTSHPPALHNHALDHLRYIRETMQRAGSFTSVSGVGAICAGVLALIAAALAWVQPTIERWLLAWILTAIVAATVSGILMTRKAKKGNTPLLSPLGRRFLLGFSTPLVAGAVLTAVLYQSSTTDRIPGMWLLLYGTAVVTGGAFSVRIVPLMGGCFMALGALTFFTKLPEANLMLAAGFGLLHFVFGWIIIRRYGG